MHKTERVLKQNQRLVCQGGKKGKRAETAFHLLNPTPFLDMILWTGYMCTCVSKFTSTVWSLSFRAPVGMNVPEETLARCNGSHFGSAAVAGGGWRNRIGLFKYDRGHIYATLHLFKIAN